MKPKILAIDTATSACSVALQIDNEIIEYYEVTPKQHSTLILPMIQDVLKIANLRLNELDAIAFGHGPGSFTGVRLAASITQGLCFGANIPAIGISTLQAIAERAFREKKVNNVLVACNAYMQEIYFAAYIKNNDGFMEAVIPDMISKAENLCLPKKLAEYEWYAAGDAWEQYNIQIKHNIEKENIIYPSAKDIVILARAKFKRGEILKTTEITPVYLQNNLYNKTM